RRCRADQRRHFVEFWRSALRRTGRDRQAVLLQLRASLLLPVSSGTRDCGRAALLPCTSCGRSPAVPLPRPPLSPELVDRSGFPPPLSRNAGRGSVFLYSVVRISREDRKSTR